MGITCVFSLDMHAFLMHWSVIATKFDPNSPLEGAVPASILYIYDTNFVPNIMQIFLVITKKGIFSAPHCRKLFLIMCHKGADTMMHK